MNNLKANIKMSTFKKISNLFKKFNKWPLGTYLRKAS